MCTRYDNDLSVVEMAEFYRILDQLDHPAPDRRDRTVRPTDVAPIIGLAEGHRVLRWHRWGLIPSWAPDLKFGVNCINARSETAATKPAFRAAYAKRRCLVPARGFIDWRTEGRSKTQKTPFYFRQRDRSPFAMAGLWEVWRNGETGEDVRTFTVLTCEPSEDVRPIHHRMPVILPPECWEAWLNPRTDAANLQAMLRPAPDGSLEAFNMREAVDHGSLGEPLPNPSKQGTLPMERTRTG